MKFRFSIKLLIVSLAIVGVLFTMVNSYYTTYQLQKNLLINMTLEANRVYAEKLALITDTFLDNARAQLTISASFIAPIMEKNADEGVNLQLELNKIRNTSASFNSLAIMNTDYVFTSVSPSTLGLRGKTIDKSLQPYFYSGKEQFIGPFTAQTGNYLVLITHPIYSSKGKHIGDLLGTMYLHDNLFLERIISQHSYDDDSYVYVVSKQKELIYHPDDARIGEFVYGNKVIDQVVDHKRGSMEVINSQGDAMVAGYAFVEDSQWGIVAQTPRESVLNELNRQFEIVIKDAIPLQILIILFVIAFAHTIAHPLRQLALSTTKKNRGLKINAWFYEAYLLKKAVHKEIDSLNEQVLKLDDDRKTDPLTGLLNRRAMEDIVANLSSAEKPFSLIFFDIDHFKQVNDNFGHDAGDDVLKDIATIIKQYFAQQDSCVRSGGEEFVIIMPGKNTQKALEHAEKIRTLVEQFTMPAINRNITISLGLSNWRRHANLSESFRRADLAMYQSKKAGRNRITCDFID